MVFPTLSDIVTLSVIVVPELYVVEYDALTHPLCESLQFTLTVLFDAVHTLLPLFVPQFGLVLSNLNGFDTAVVDSQFPFESLTSTGLTFKTYCPDTPCGTVTA